MYRRILATLDGSRLSEAVLPAVQQLAAGTSTHVTVLTVVETPESTAARPETEPLVATAPAPGVIAHLAPATTVETKGQAIERARHNAQTYLDGVVQPLREHGIAIETVVLFGNPVAEILACAGQREAELIVMATHGRTGMTQVLFGGVASRVVGQAGRPVLLVRPRDLGSAPAA